MIPNLAEVAGNFQFEGNFVEAKPHGSGHIHDTYAAWCRDKGGKSHPYLLQRINQHVFRDPEGLVQNISRVTRHLQHKIAKQGGDPLRETLTLIPTRLGDYLYKDEQGGCWRAYVFIENTHSTDKVSSPKQVYQAAKAYGLFQSLLADFPAGCLIETIPNFHNTPKRLLELQETIERDSHKRVSDAQKEIRFVADHAGETSLLVDMLDQGILPERIIHNDTKLNNVLFDNVSGNTICVIDLDTVMPGTVLYDFGDAVRSACALSGEDEARSDHSGLSLDTFEQMVHGYLEIAGVFLTPTEMDHLVFSAKMMTLECGMRFLTDHLNGDVYFKINRPGQNLDRCRVQLRLVEDIERNDAEMNRIIGKYRELMPSAGE